MSSDSCHHFFIECPGKRGDLHNCKECAELLDKYKQALEEMNQAYGKN